MNEEPFVALREGRIGVFIVGGDYICIGRGKGRCGEQEGEGVGYILKCYWICRSTAISEQI